MSPLELPLFGAACCVFGLVSGAVLIPWLVDQGLFGATDVEAYLESATLESSLGTFDSGAAVGADPGYPQGAELGARGPRSVLHARPSFPVFRRFGETRSREPEG